MDSAVFLGTLLSVLNSTSADTFSSEFIPGSHQYLLSMLTVWRALGQLMGSFVSPPFLHLSMTVDL